jgi:hypothetical protein
MQVVHQAVRSQYASMYLPGDRETLADSRRICVDEYTTSKGGGSMRSESFALIDGLHLGSTR